MPTKVVNHHAAGHAQDLLTLASTTYKDLLKGSIPSPKTTEDLRRFVNALRKELGHDVDTSDPFLTEGPKPAPVQSDVAKLPTVQVHAVSPIVEKPKEEAIKKSGFLGR